jgi:hypothetical protein
MLGVDSEPGRSVSIVSGYVLENREIEVRSPAEEKDFYSNLSVLNGSEAHRDSCKMDGYWGSFPRAKARPGRDADHSPYVVPRSRMSRSYASSPSERLSWRVVGQF